MSVYFVYLIVLIASILVGIYLNWFFLKKSKKHSLKKANTTGVRWGSQSKPVSGGISFFIVSTIAVIAFIFIYGKDVIFDFSLVGIFIVATIAFLMGLADDIINTSPYFKFFVQILCAALLIYFGIYIEISSSTVVNYLITGFWVVGIMNSINMLDNMDAVTSLVTLSIFSGIAYIMLGTAGVNSTHHIFLLFALIGSIISFLIYNWYPSKMYMGDNGSQFIGVLLAAFGIIAIWKVESPVLQKDQVVVVYAVVIAFLIPLSDTATVTINRLLKGKSPFVGGKDHTTHHLTYLGLSEKWVAVVFFLLSIISVVIAIYIIKFIDKFSVFHYVIFTAYICIVFLFLYINTRICKPK